MPKEREVVKEKPVKKERTVSQPCPVCGSPMKRVDIPNDGSYMQCPDPQCGMRTRSN